MAGFVASGLLILLGLSLTGCGTAPGPIPGGPVLVTGENGQTEGRVVADWNDVTAAVEWAISSSEVAILKREVFPPAPPAPPGAPVHGHRIVYHLMGQGGQDGELVISRAPASHPPGPTLADPGSPSEPITLVARFDRLGRERWADRTQRTLVSSAGARLNQLAGRDFHLLPDTRD